MSLVLFIGGSQDGTRRMVDELPSVYRVPFKKNTPLTFISETEAMESVQIDAENYHRHVICVKGTDFYLYAIETLSDPEVFDKLLRGYKS